VIAHRAHSRASNDPTPSRLELETGDHATGFGTWGSMAPCPANGRSASV